MSEQNARGIKDAQDAIARMARMERATTLNPTALSRTPRTAARRPVNLQPRQYRKFPIEKSFHTGLDSLALLQAGGCNHLNGGRVPFYGRRQNERADKYLFRN
jgi:hypothetical protein